MINEILCPDTICFLIGHSIIEKYHLNCGGNFEIFPNEALFLVAAATYEREFTPKPPGFW